MKRQYIIPMFLLCCVMLLLVACSENLFGSPSNTNCGSDIKCLRMDAENAFRNAEYSKAHKIFSQIVELDSTASAGYFGMAKAGLWMKGVNPFRVFAHVNTGGDEIAFMNDFPADQNRYYQAMRFISPALHELEHRDSITLHYDYYKRNLNGFDTTFTRTMDSVSWSRAVEANDFDLSKIDSIVNEWEKNKTYIIPLSQKLKKFISKYNCSAGKCNEKILPLSDREYIYDSYSYGLLITSVSETILKSMDTNGDGCIAKRCPDGLTKTECRKYNPGDTTSHEAWENWGCEKRESYPYSYDLSINLVVNENGEFEVDLNKLLDDMDLGAFYIDQLNSSPEIIDLPPDIQNFNTKMDEFNESIYDLMSTMGGFKDKNNGDMPFGLDGDMGAYKDYSKFYKVGTHIDEDGDGCIDEDILDGQDNDGDGLVNGNARLAYIDDPTNIYYADDGLMGFHGMTGNKDDDKPIRIKKNDPAYASKCIISNNERNDGTNCADLTPDEDGYVTVIKFTQRPGYWTSNNRDDKLRVAQDTACPPKISLAQRKVLIGGCWSNYNEDKFVKYWLKREFARPEDRDKRVHSSCKNCIGAACLR